MALPPNDAVSKGFSAGIQVWLIFLLVFWVLGYAVPLSILLGAIGGVASGTIIFWWEIKEEPKKEEIIEDASLEDVAIVRENRRRFRTLSRRAKRKQEFSWELLWEQVQFWKRI
ncbi:hypothetical protein ACN4EG_15410 [Alkalinema pantanalense CENA528]|uniref:hypothetical protein n=1 Tax=Alkalinema pantanalense TaxID=1620705 RepID=UPI003D6FB1CD